MSVDVSPDGATLVFDLLGDLYALPFAGGTARALTSGPAWDSQPRFSPDGRTIAFTSDRDGIENIWLVDADGKNPRALTQEKDFYVRTAAWTPDGAYLVARKQDGRKAGLPPVELWLYHREGGGGIKLTSSEEVNNASGAAPSKDGRWIYLSTRKAAFSYVPDLTPGSLADLALRPHHGRDVPGDGGLRGRRAPAALARREAARLREPPRRKHRPGASRPGHGRRERRGHGRPPRRAGRLRPDRPLARLRLHARRRVARLLERGQDREAGPRDPPARGDSLSRAGRPVDGAPRRLAGEAGHRPRAGPHPALGRRIVRREPDRIRRLRPCLRPGPRGRQAGGRSPAAHRGRAVTPPARVRARFLARREVGGLRHLERQGRRPHLEGSRRGRRAAAAHGARRPLRQPVVVRGRRPARVHPRVGPRVPRPPAGAGGRLRDPLAGGRGRRDPLRDVREALQREELPPSRHVERRRHASLLPGSGRAQEAHGRPQGRPGVGAARRHRQAPSPPAAHAVRARPLARRPVGGLRFARQRLRGRAPLDPHPGSRPRSR